MTQPACPYPPDVVQIPCGIGPPNILNQTQDAGQTGIDLTTVTAVTLTVTRPDGLPPVQWSAAILAATPPTAEALSTITWGHAFAPADTQGLPGLYLIDPWFTVPGGQVPGSRVEFQAYV